MGNGASSAEIDAHLRKWEAAVNDLSALCQHNKRSLGITAPSVIATTPTVAESSPEGKAMGGAPATLDDNNPDTERSLHGRRASSLVSFGANRPAGGVATNRSEIADNGEMRSPKPVEFLGTRDEKEAQSQKNPKHNRQHIMDVRKARNALFKSYVDAPIRDVKGKLACDHFATVAIALSAVLGGHANATDRKERVTVEDIFFAAHVPLHLLHTESMHLTELFDIVREFVDVDNRFKGQYKVEVLHFDIAPTVGQVELGSNEVGDRQTKMQLPEFRKSIIHELEEETNSVIIVNYDPFVLEQEMTIEDDEDEEEEDKPVTHQGSAAGLLGTGTNDALMASVMNLQGNQLKKSGPQFSKNNKGIYAAVVDYRNAVQFMVSLALGAVSDKLHADIEEVPLKGLFKAVMKHESGERARGYIRISKRTNGGNSGESMGDNMDVAADTGCTFFSPELCSGKVVGSLSEGAQAHTLQQSFSPHLVAVAWGLHLINGASENTHNHGRGLPVGDIIRTLRLPSDAFFNCDLPLEQVYLYAEAYLNRKKLDSKFTLSLCPVLTRVNRDNAVPTISVFDFESVLLDNRAANEDPEAPSSVMLIQYNADVAHNVLGIASSSQWCILCGYDPETQTAILIDANQKIFCATWTCPLDRLHKAITTYGYLLLNRVGVNSGRPKSSDSSRSSTPSSGNNNNSKSVPTVVQNRIELIKSVMHQDTIEVIPNFPFPPFAFGITCMALALARVGLTRATFDDIVDELPFHPSAILDTHYGLEAFLVCLRLYLTRIEMNNQYNVEETHFDRDPDDESRPKITQKMFADMIQEAVSLGENKCALVVHFDPHLITILGTSKPYGDYGIVLGYNAAQQVVTLGDVNPNRFHRSWQVSLEMLHKATSHFKHQGRRSRGVITIKRMDNPVEKPQPAHFRRFSLDIVPIQKVFQISPSPQVQGLSIAFAQLGHEYSPEEIFYEAYLKTVADQRRRGSQAFAWRDVDVSLAILNKKIDARVMTLVARKFIESRKVTNLSVEQLDDVDVSDLPELLQEACNPSSDFILMLNYDPALVHGLKNMGSSVALIQSYDQETDRVGFFECEYCLYGLQWFCDFAKLVRAADIDNPGTSKYGFVKMSRKQAEKRQGFGMGGKSPHAQPMGDEHSKREKMTTFV